MADDVALDLRSPGFDGIAPRSQKRVSPLAVIDRVRVAFAERRKRSQQFGRDLLEALVQLRPENFQYRALRPRHTLLIYARNGAHLIQAHDFDVSVALA